MSSFTFLKVFLLALFISGLSAGVCQFDCASNCLVVTSKVDQGDGTALVTVSAESCKGSAVSWIACMNTGCSAVSCNGVATSSSGNKCDEVLYATFLFQIAGSGVSFQIHDGVQAGNLICTSPPNSNCAGGGGAGCTVNGERVSTGVCVIDFLDEFWDSEDFTNPECTSDAGCVAADLCNVAHCGTDGKCHQDIAPTSRECRASAGPCDVAEYCDGVNAACPVDSFKSTTEVCREALTFVNENTCDKPEYCLGNSADCPEDIFLAAQTLCRAQDGLCDTEERCTGNSPRCPPDNVEPDTTVCRPKVVNPVDQTSCDVAEYCDGTLKTCPEDQFQTSSYVCRNSAGDCDLPELCPGNSNACPADAKSPTTTICRAAVVASDQTTCDKTEYCDGVNNDCPQDEILPSGSVCRPNTDSCDVPELCTGTKVCPTDLRNDHGYVYKCGTTCFLCGVTFDELSINGGSYTLGGCGIGKCDFHVQLAWPQCVDQCVNSLCPNNKGLSNNEVYNCNANTGDWYCVWKWEGSDVATGTCPNGKYSLTTQFTAP